MPRKGLPPRKFTCTDCGLASYGPRCRRCTNIRLNKARAKPDSQRALARLRREQGLIRQRIVRPPVEAAPSWWVVAGDRFYEEAKQRFPLMEPVTHSNYSIPEYP